MAMSSAMMTSAVTSMVLMTIFFSMEEKDSLKKEEKMSFECGFSNMTPIKMSFSTNFIMVIIMFLVFDIEVSIMVPMMMTEKIKQEQVMLLSLFLMLLTLIMMKEWDQGTIDWSK